MTFAQVYALVVLAIAAGLAWSGLRLAPDGEPVDLLLRGASALGMIGVVLHVASPL